MQEACGSTSAPGPRVTTSGLARAARSAFASRASTSGSEPPILSRRGLLKRLRLSPLPTWTLLTAILLSTLLIAFSQVVLMLAVGRWAFGVQLPSSPSGIGALVVVLILGGLSFAALGIAMSTFIPNQQAAGPVTSTVFFVLLFLSGLWFPLKSGSTLAKISTFFPIRHFITAVFKTFNHPGSSAWSGHDLLIVVIWVWWAPRSRFAGFNGRRSAPDHIRRSPGALVPLPDGRHQRSAAR